MQARTHMHADEGGASPLVPLTADVGDQLELQGQPLGAAALRG